MLHWKPTHRSCDALDAAAVWPSAGQVGAFPLSEVAPCWSDDRIQERSAASMEYAEAINEEAAERAMSFALHGLTKGRSDYRALASEAVTHAYCVCVTQGEDAAEHQFSKIHRNLIDQLELKLRRLFGEESE
jgi:hypothetical protein